MTKLEHRIKIAFKDVYVSSKNLKYYKSHVNVNNKD